MSTTRQIETRVEFDQRGGMFFVCTSTDGGFGWIAAATRRAASIVGNGTASLLRVGVLTRFE